MLLGLIRFEVWAIVIAFGMVIAIKLLNGRINARGLLRESPDGPISVTRVQLLFATLYAAAAYLQKLHGSADITQLPDVSQDTLLILGGSNIVFLGAKANSLLGGLISLQSGRPDGRG